MNSSLVDDGTVVRVSKPAQGTALASAQSPGLTSGWKARQCPVCKNWRTVPESMTFDQFMTLERLSTDCSSGIYPGELVPQKRLEQCSKFDVRNGEWDWANSSAVAKKDGNKRRQR